MCYSRMDSAPTTTLLFSFISHMKRAAWDTFAAGHDVSVQPLHRKPCHMVTSLSYIIECCLISLPIACIGLAIRYVQTAILYLTGSNSKICWRLQSQENLTYEGSSVLLLYSHKDIFELHTTLLQGGHSGLLTKQTACWTENVVHFLCIFNWVNEYIGHCYQI